MMSFAKVTALLCLGSLLVSAAAPTPKGTSKELDIQATGNWVDTAIDIGVQGRLKISATGSIQYAGAQSAAGPAGLSRGWKDLVRTLPVNSAGRGALIGRIGSADFAQPFVIGANQEITAGSAGRLYLSVNQGSNDQATGSFRVRIEVLDSGRENSADLASVDKLPVQREFLGIDAPTLQKIPRRVSDSDGNAGDMVNFLILGSEQAVLKAFAAAGWVQVDRTKQDALVHGLFSTLSKQSYVEMPMSDLYLFGRPQDHGLAHAEPIAVVAQRHHLRIWKAPFDINGVPLWAGAATHDIGFEKDQRNGKVTHKIDPAVDVERKFVGESLAATGLVSKIGFMTPTNAVRDAHTATGGSFQSDGRILVMQLAPPEPTSR